MNNIRKNLAELPHGPLRTEMKALHFARIYRAGPLTISRIKVNPTFARIERNFKNGLNSQAD